MRRAPATFISILLGATALSVVPSPAGAHLGGEHFQVTARLISEHYNDVGRKGPSAGDTAVFTDKLFRKGRRVGRDSVRCDITRVTRRAFTQQCVGTVTLRRRGALTVQGEVRFRRGVNSFRLAITGGTGDFAGAAGEFVVIDRRGEPTRYRIHLMG